MKTRNTSVNQHNEPRWMSYFKKLKDFHARNGHFRVSCRSKSKKLYHWQYNQRIYCSNNKLSKERRDLLNSIGFFDEPEDPQPASSQQPLEISMASRTFQSRRISVPSGGTPQLNRSSSSTMRASENQDESSVHASEQSSPPVIDLTMHKKSLKDRVKSLEAIVGIAPEANHSLCHRVTLLEIDIFGKGKNETLKERIEHLESEVE